MASTWMKRLAMRSVEVLLHVKPGSKTVADDYYTEVALAA
jgi:hypothetical protein